MAQKYTQAVVEGLAHLRAYALKYPTMGLSEAVNALDNAGVFHEVDEQADYDVTPALSVLKTFTGERS